MKPKLFSLILSLSFFASASLLAQENFERLISQVESNPQLSRQLTQFNVSNDRESAQEIVLTLIDQFPELSCNICLGALDAMDASDDLDEEAAAQLLSAVFAAHPDLATQIGSCVAEEYEAYEPLITELLEDFEEPDVEERVEVLPALTPTEEITPPDTVTTLDSVVASPN